MSPERNNASLAPDLYERRNSGREFDIVLFGASGVVGKLTASYLSNSGSEARIALAGRCPEKLARVRSSLGRSAHDWPIIVADATQPASIIDMARRTQVVLSTVGPYLLYGMPLVQACAEEGTDYADLTGETMFIRRSIDRLHGIAVASGARILHSCGFDSLPSDLTVYALNARSRSDGAGNLTRTDMVMLTPPVAVSGGTIASGIEMLRQLADDPDARRHLADPYTLSPNRQAEPGLGDQPDIRWGRGIRIAPELERRWTGAFPMALMNTRIVRRTNALLGYEYGREFAYAEHILMNDSAVAPVMAALVTAGFSTMYDLGTRYMNRVPRSLIERIAPPPGTGPGEDIRENSGYRLHTYTTTASGIRYRASMSQRGDPGYKATSALFGECGLALATARDQLSDLRGVLTPAAAMGDVLLSRLARAGATLEIEQLPGTEA
ncbi:MAG: saccharopine dehydrogenase NADP-binding domain-containing protein [Gordonia sp. (in: high G+C Gram-positive bacteria)]|uniref:saccharopine dehydrogenase family protein n=1 Tax=Gordonia sp. (in: high G+C Gram-positive bacteria) TaxID=84139 RepID=UPI003BB683D1